MNVRPDADDDDDDKKGDKGDRGGGDEGGLLKSIMKSRTILVAEVVSDKLYQKVVSRLLLMQMDDDKAPVTVIVNSPGGAADSGFAIYDALRAFKPPIRTVCNGLCASAAVLIFLAAPKERRGSLPNSRFLLHQPSTMMMGTASDIQINADEILKLRERYNTIVSQETGKSVDQITRDADRDFWLSPTQAKEYGLVGKVIKSMAEMEK